MVAEDGIALLPAQLEGTISGKDDGQGFYYPLHL